MPPKKRRCTAQRPRSQKVIEKEVLTEWKPTTAGRSADEVCGACLLPVESDCQVGLVDSCVHIFHHECAERWAQTENSCPQCKLRFFWLASYNQFGRRTSLKQVERRDQEGEEDDDPYEDIQVCEACKQVGDESALLLCDGMHGTCNAAYHYACVGLTSVPRGSWFCPDCSERGFDTDASGRRGAPTVVPEVRQDATTTAVTEHSRTPSSDLASVTVSRPEAVSSTSVPTAASASSSPDAQPDWRRTEQQPADPGPVTPSSASNPTVNGNRRITRGRGSVPPQLRLSSLACVTPAMEVPAYRAAPAPKAAAGGTQANAPPQEPLREGLFASFAQRRQRRRQAEAATTTESTPSFINLNPSFEEDFMGKGMK